MRKLAMLSMGLLMALGLSFVALGITPGGETKARAADSAITIQQFQFSPADLTSKVGQPVTITNNDDFPHTVTAKDGDFDVTVPAKGTATVTPSKAGKHDYTCTMHPGQHNPASITAS